MNKLKMTLLTGGLLVMGSMLASSAQAQVFVYRPIVGPRLVARAAIAPVRVAPVTVARTTVATATLAPPVVTTYNTLAPTVSVVPTYTTPTITTYRTVQPVVVGPVIRPVIRSAWIPGQPVRNAVRFAIR